jgi:ferredoxin
MSLKIFVDLKLCQGHGECSRVAPDLFTLDPDLVLTWVGEADDDRKNDVEDAVDACPVGAISRETIVP